MPYDGIRSVGNELVILLDGKLKSELRAESTVAVMSHRCTCHDKECADKRCRRDTQVGETGCGQECRGGGGQVTDGWVRPSKDQVRFEGLDCVSEYLTHNAEIPIDNTVRLLTLNGTRPQLPTQAVGSASALPPVVPANILRSVAAGGGRGGVKPTLIPAVVAKSNGSFRSGIPSPV